MAEIMTVRRVICGVVRLKNNLSTILHDVLHKVSLWERVSFGPSASAMMLLLCLTTRTTGVTACGSFLGGLISHLSVFLQNRQKFFLAQSFMRKDENA